MFSSTFRLGVALPQETSHDASDSKSNAKDTKHSASDDTRSSTQHEETPKVESEPESELGTFMSESNEICSCDSMSIELDTTGVVEGDNDAAQSMGDANMEVGESLQICLRVLRCTASV